MAEMIKVTSKAQFEELVKEGNVMVDFNATWCGPCKMLMPLVKELAAKTEDVKFLDVDVDLNQDIAVEFQIMSIPSLMMFKDGQQAKKHVGFMAPNQLEEFVK
ncbi:thioredoxin [[Acholeplasma] multilocale]|uniref:thioredoxin n=1 Tax=[Acholeplasma] multilocale TaxID=264638 RepID=UPI00047C64F4|nr:thioredoxin [[Acholeplasma] multilocale]